MWTWRWAERRRRNPGPRIRWTRYVPFAAAVLILIILFGEVTGRYWLGALIAVVFSTLARRSQFFTRPGDASDS